MFKMWIIYVPGDKTIGDRVINGGLLFLNMLTADEFSLASVRYTCRELDSKEVISVYFHPK